MENNFDDLFDSFELDDINIETVEESNNMSINDKSDIKATNENNYDNEPNNTTKEDNNVQTPIESTSNNKITSDNIFKPSIPEFDEEYVENATIEIEGQDPIDVQFKFEAKPKEDYEIAMWDTINKFETEAWSDASVGLKTGWDCIDKGFDGGLKPGFIVVGGDSNLGKSALMTQLAIQVAENNPEAYVMDFSLDDPINDKLPRVIGCSNKIILNAVKTPKNYLQYPLMIARRKEGINKLRKYVGNYRAYDANFTTFIEEIEEEIERNIINFKSKGIDKKVVVLIDNLHDLNIRDQPGLQDKNKYDIIAQWAADIAIKHNIPVVCTAELKKLNSTRRPTLDDIRECVKIKYEAKAVLLVYNEVHYKGENALVYFNRSTSPLKQPVFEVHYAKNKISSFKGRCFFEFFPEMARLEESDATSTKLYNSLVYGN